MGDEGLSGIPLFTRRAAGSTRAGWGSHAVIPWICDAAALSTRPKTATARPNASGHAASAGACLSLLLWRSLS